MVVIHINRSGSTDLFIIILLPTDNFLYGLEIVMNNLNREEIGLKIKVRRICNHISQTDLAKWLDISQTHMSNVEAGKAMLSIELLFEVKQILGCTIDELLGLDVKEQKKCLFRTKKLQIVIKR